LAIKVMGDIPVRVAVRVRPFSQREQAESARPCVSCYEENNQVAINGKMFAFDHVFDTGASQENVYEACALPMLECLFKGYNCTLLAYGQTGSGKTYTMGTEETSESMSSERRGIIARMVDAIFQQIGSSQRFKVSVSMLEIYEERVVDLLTLSRDGLQIREMNGAVFVQGLSCEKVDSLTATMNQLEKGCLLRSKGVTAMNNKSSRSHAIFTITIEKLFTEDGDDGCFKSKLHLVDLAGSERLKKTQAEGERMREGIKINEGLLALGNVIAALSESSTSNRHIPYRDSKITRLLQDSLGGNSYTVMIACISPADTNAEETLSTLRYADRTKRIKNKPIVNVDPSFAMVEALRNELAAAKHQIAILMTGQQPILVTCVAHLLIFTRFCLTLNKWILKKTYLRSDAVAEKERLKRELGNSQDEIRRLNLCLAEEAVEKSHILESAFAATQALETLKQRLRAAFKGRAEESEILNVLDASLSVVEDQNTESVDKDKTEEEDGEESTADQIYVAQFAEKQSALSRELASLLDEIRNKERAYEATEQSSEQLAKMRAVHEAELEELQAKLAALEKERDELQAKLKGSSIHHKLSEERRKRLAELEKETECYRRRMMELKRIKKENSNLQERAKKLTQELLELKKLRVKMVRQMKDEEAKFRKWKLKADRELLQMKSRERKREVEAARAKQITAQQLAVYRRKYEEANACNRRLHQQLARGSSVRKQGQKDGDQLIAYFDNELEIAISAAEARWHCEVLIEQRKALAQQLRKKQDLRNKLSNEPPRKVGLFVAIIRTNWDEASHVLKRRTGSNHSNFDDESEKHKLDQEIESLQQEIELRATEIHELQAKCINSDEREEQRWSVVGSLANAKITLKHLFDAVVNQRRAAFEKKQAIEEQMSAHEEETKMVEKEIRELKEALRREQDASKALRDHIARRELDLDETTMDLISSWDTALERNPDTFDVSVVKRLEKALQAQLAQREAPKRAKKTKENMASKRRSEEFDENDLEESLSFSDDPDDESYLPTPDRRRRNKKRAKRSHPQPCRSGPQTFVVETPFPSSSNAGDMNDQEEYKENNAQNGNEPSATMNTTYTIADDAPLPKSVLGTDPVELKTRRKNRPRKAVNSSISTPERRKQVEQMFANL
uniref:Kinesin motor domain-containing protein n=1 Tax=Toxocara canis TaxID=6265 RepID=A0A183TVX3_TOXCA